MKNKTKMYMYETYLHYLYQINTVKWRFCIMGL